MGKVNLQYKQFIPQKIKSMNEDGATKIYLNQDTCLRLTLILPSLHVFVIAQLFNNSIIQ